MAVRARLAAVILVSALTFGCAAFHTAVGDSAAGRRDWDSAFESYRSAVARDPENLELRAKLERARSAAAAAHRESGTRAFLSACYGDAIAELKASLRYEADAPTSQMLERAYAGKRRHDAALAMQSGSRLENERSLASARESYTHAADLNPELAPEVKRRVAAIDERIARAEAIAAQASARLARGDFAGARTLSVQALAIHAREPSALGVQRIVLAEDDALEHEQAALAAEAELDFEEAVARAREAHETRSTPARGALVGRLEARAYRHFARRGERAFERERWSEAIEAFELARRYGPDPEALAGPLLEARYELEYELGWSCERRDDRHGALEHYRRAYGMRSSESLGARIAALERPEPRP